jgi:hypothetical protein
MIHVLLATLLLAIPALCAAQSEERVVKPEIRVGDSWSYRSKNMLGNGVHTYDLKVENSDGKTIQVVATRRGDSREFDGTFTSEWNAVVGVSGLIFTPSANVFTFPLRVGDTQSSSYTASRPRSNVPPARVEAKVLVAGWEQVTVPAGTFRAIKVVVNADNYPPSSREPTKLLSTFWYVPEVRRWVKFTYVLPNLEAEEELLEYKLNEN